MRACLFSQHRLQVVIDQHLSFTSRRSPSMGLVWFSLVFSHDGNRTLAGFSSCELFGGGEVSLCGLLVALCTWIAYAAQSTIPGKTRSMQMLHELFSELPEMGAR